MEGMINYFLPADGDEEEHCNIFPMRKPIDSVCLVDVKQNFPLPGKYHFRFKQPYESTFVWMDVTNDADVVPNFKGLIIAKITRVGMTVPSVGCNPTASNGAKRLENSTKSSSTGTHNNTRPPQASQTKKAPERAAEEVDLLKDQPAAVSSSSAPAATAADSLLDLGGFDDAEQPSTPTSQIQQPANFDPFASMPSTPIQQSSPSPPISNNNMSRDTFSNQGGMGMGMGGMGRPMGAMGAGIGRGSMGGRGMGGMGMANGGMAMGMGSNGGIGNMNMGTQMGNNGIGFQQQGRGRGLDTLNGASLNDWMK